MESQDSQITIWQLGEGSRDVEVSSSMKGGSMSDIERWRIVGEVER